MIGIEKLVTDLKQLNHDVISQLTVEGIDYVIIKDYVIPSGTFAERVIDLAIPAPADSPRSFPSSIQIKAAPHLTKLEHISGVRNVIASPLGIEWQYWSYQFRASTDNPSSTLIGQINAVFRKN